MSVPDGVTVVDHVLLRRLVSILRDRETPHGGFRQTLDDAAMILAYEAMRGLRHDEIEVQTPLEPAAGTRLADQVVIVAILRAGLGLVDGFLRLVPDARVGHLGMYRDEEALRPVGYYENVPPGVEDAEVFVVDPMLATGGSATQAIARLKRAGARRVTFVCLVAAPEGVAGAARRASRGADHHRRARPRARHQRLHPPRAWATRATASSAPTAEPAKTTVYPAAPCRSPRRLILLALACAALLAVAGCGSDSLRGARLTSTPEAAATPEATKPEITVPEGQGARRSSWSRTSRRARAPTAEAGKQVTVQYVGISFLNGRQFDASWDRGEPFSFQLGAGSVIPGWDQGVEGMKVGGRRQLVIPPDLAYGPQGSPPDDRAERDAGLRDRPGQRPELAPPTRAPPRHGAQQRAEQQPLQLLAREVARARPSRGSPPSMNHSHARTAVRSAGGGAAPARCPSRIRAEVASRTRSTTSRTSGIAAALRTSLP